MIKPPKRVFVHNSVANSRIVQNLKSSLPGADFILLDENEETAGKLLSRINDLAVIRFKGRFVRSCPATKYYHCCGYVILHFGERCTIGCTYCILQAYWNQPCLKLFGNTDEMLSEVESMLHNHPDILFRIGTGEFTDSLLLDPWTGFSEIIVPFFANQPNAILELKTKTTFINRLSNLEPMGHTIVSWSLNALNIVSTEESKAPPISERLDAAKQCVDWGYFLAFHFDPIFYFPGWQEAYRKTIEMLFRKVPTDRIVYISLGSFRFMPGLKKEILKKRPQWKLASGEFITGLDGKKRYFRDIRVKLYRFFVSEILSRDSSLCVYLCMESGTVWRDAFGFSPSEKGGLPEMLDRAVKERMGVGAQCTRSASHLLLQKPQPSTSSDFSSSKII